MKRVQSKKKETREEFLDLKQFVQTQGEEIDCPIWPDCQARVMATGDTAAPRRFWSPRAGGVFTIPLCISTNDIQVPDEETRKRVSSWIWEKNITFETLSDEEAEPPLLAPEVISKLAEREPLSTEQRIDWALRAIGRPPARLSVTERDNTQIFKAATGCGEDRQEMIWLLEELSLADLVRNASKDDYHYRYMITLAGLNRLETGGQALVSNTAFVAMWFDDEIRKAYVEGIEPAIRRAGYEPMRIDRKHHVRKIDDEIVAEIRRCRFMVCDLTSSLLDDPDSDSGKTPVARGGVYYEAGFAQGLDKTVIWTCRKDVAEHVHFDIRQYNRIEWESGKENELSDALYERIRAAII